MSLIWEGLARAVGLVLGADPEILAITWLSLDSHQTESDMGSIGGSV